MLCGCGGPTEKAQESQPQLSDAEARVSELPAWGSVALQAPSALEARLLAAELKRDPGDPALEEALASSEARVRERGARALGHIGGPTALRRLAALVDAPDDAGSTALAFLDPPRQTPRAPAVPAGAWAELEDALWTRYALTDESSDAAAEGVLLALGRIGGPRSVDRFAIDLARTPVGSGHRRYIASMTALAVVCARGHALTETARDAVVQGLEAAQPQVRHAAIYALGRCARTSAEVLALANEREVIVERLGPSLERGEDEEARLAWKVFAALGELPAEIPPGILGKDPPSWRTEVEAVRALNQKPAGQDALVARLSDADLGNVAGSRFHAFHEALRGLRGPVGSRPALREQLTGFDEALAATEPPTPHDAHALALLRCELSLLHVIGTGSLGALSECKGTSLPPHYPEILAIDALLHVGEAMDRTQRVEALLTRAEDSRAAVAAPALSALAELDDPRANEVLRKALDRLDVGVVSAAASAIAARSVDASKRDPMAVSALTRTIRQLSNAEAAEARIAAIEALGSLGRTPQPGVVESPQSPAEVDSKAWLSEVILPLRDDPNFALRRAGREALLGHDELIEQFDAGGTPRPSEFGSAMASFVSRVTAGSVTGLRVKTSAGEFVIDFQGSPSPHNQANLTELASRGYYDGLRFHRVVPDFVIQGGDPRGDGYGGPGHVVPCEWSNLRYERGSVGIALAGKDTGGSQFFVTHSAQPHLDARYTIVGRVSEGMEVVDRIMVGDVIESVEVIEAGS
jgi:cyclophilin family peptidyl-prolyl cis-trans isomerase/HEAT repeat protein